MDGLENNQPVYTVSNHAKERYAERIMGRRGIADVRKFVNDHDDEIEKWLNKMIEHGRSIYVGPLGRDNYVEVFINGMWVIITGPAKKAVVTLYKIELGDEEVNDLFVRKMLMKIDQAHERVKSAETSSSELKESYQAVIDTNNQDIADMKKQIDNLQEINAAYSTLMDNASMECTEEMKKLRKLVEKLIGRQEF